MKIRPGLSAGVMLLSAALTVSAQTSSGPVHMPSATNTPAAATAPDPAAAVWSQPLKMPNSAATPAVNAAPVAPTTQEEGDIRDIRGPISIPYAWLWLIWVAVSLLAAAALFCLWRFIQSRRKPKEKLHFELALELLDEALSQVTAQKITVREYAFLVSEVIRLYIENRFGEQAAHLTTEEFLSNLVGETNSPLASHRGRLEDFLSHCDLIKYARWGASTREIESMHESARTFIVETKPQPEKKAASTEGKPQPQEELAQVK